ncbi:hypothetical protein AM588_10000944 [Phytophthora nicotianae]|uniref:Uncharacterized protein n=1 Tax=Phytophthora nicotianae TaxID=4792 RepID=A0A0W8CN20_PHYNI|nr:hypothetical protein AM588_10000944 [Phytophthora nicotianae]
MDLTEIPFDVPVILQSICKGKSLQNPLGSKKARCLTDNRDVYEQMVLRRVRDDKIAIQSGHNGRFLQVRASGDCVFDRKEPGEWELFTMETDSSCALYFVSCHTGNVLQCNNSNDARCANENRQDWEAWRIVEPRSSAASTQPQRGDRENFILELARCGKSPAEIEQIVTSMFDVPLATATASALVVQVEKE